MPSMEHFNIDGLHSEQKVKIMKNRIQSLNYLSYVSSRHTNRSKLTHGL